ncbi:hypothetical protein B0H16DRAFT_1468218 [Mycena metata]|uniref:Uncharacterized protein n=1 Tax=Mycena metata TaxID=1033252 RepID=A0AAD7I1V8_9AGAR|nr:hypothetical protein B0H16DRAFT_1468218 [Mycena metata]
MKTDFNIPCKGSMHKTTMKSCTSNDESRDKSLVEIWKENETESVHGVSEDESTSKENIDARVLQRVDVAKGVLLVLPRPTRTGLVWLVRANTRSPTRKLLMCNLQRTGSLRMLSHYETDIDTGKNSSFEALTAQTDFTTILSYLESVFSPNHSEILRYLSHLTDTKYRNVASPQTRPRASLRGQIPCVTHVGRVARVDGSDSTGDAQLGSDYSLAGVRGRRWVPVLRHAVGSTTSRHGLTGGLDVGAAGRWSEEKRGPSVNPIAERWSKNGGSSTEHVRN